MWERWVDKEINHVHWLVGRLETAFDRQEARSLVKDLEDALARLRAGFWELHERLDHTQDISQSCLKRCPTAGQLSYQMPEMLRPGKDDLDTSSSKTG